MNKQQWVIDSPIGALYLVASAQGLCGVFWEQQAVAMAESLGGSEGPLKILAQAARELNEYFEGRRRTFEVALDVTGTPFQRQVWEELSKIPYGETYSYRDIAIRINNAKAVRAVGNANGKNPLCVIVPCHRAIAADGTLGGYTGGLTIKKTLLDLEKRVGAI